MHTTRAATTDYISSQVTFDTTHDAVNNIIPYKNSEYRVDSQLGGINVSIKSIDVTICSYDNIDSPFFSQPEETLSEDYLGFYVDDTSLEGKRNLNKQLTLQKTVEKTDRCDLSWDLTV